MNTLTLLGLVVVSCCLLCMNGSKKKLSLGKNQTLLYVGGAAVLFLCMSNGLVEGLESTKCSECQKKAYDYHNDIGMNSGADTCDINYNFAQHLLKDDCEIDGVVGFASANLIECTDFKLASADDVKKGVQDAEMANKAIDKQLKKNQAEE